MMAMIVVVVTLFCLFFIVVTMWVLNCLRPSILCGYIIYMLSIVIGFYSFYKL